MNGKANGPQSKIIIIEPVGQVLLERSRRAKNICLTVRPFKGVRVAVPVGVTFDQARDMARSHAAWIEKQLQNAKLMESRAAQFNRYGVFNRTVARRIIVQRLEMLAQQHGFAYNKVFVRNQKTRWGSCSTQNNINLNVHLISLPPELMDYVILHELVHTRVKDHSRRFWDRLGCLIDDPKTLDNELTRYEVLLACEG